MSDNFEMLVDVDATHDEAEETSQIVLKEFQQRGIITQVADADCILGGEEGYRPGPAVPELYNLEDNQPPFWELITCGVEVEVGRHFNVWALGPVCEGFTCPSCTAAIAASDEDFGDALAEAIGQWTDETGPALVTCPNCSDKNVVTKWHCKPPMGFGNLSFCFWNWPRFNHPGWNIDIPEIVREITGHTIVQTYGHI